MNKYISKFFLFSLISFSGCYSFYSTDIYELKNLNGKENIEVRLDRNESLKFYNTKKIDFLDNDSILIINNDSLKSRFALKEVKEIAIEKFDYTKTLLTSLFVIISIFLINGGIGSPGG